MRDRVGPVVLIGAAVFAAVVMVVKGARVMASGYDLNLVSGVWLALAADAESGLFYRGLSHDVSYGGTRYFPLLFLLIAAVMKLGLPAVAAGQVVGVASAALLAAGAFVLLRRSGVRPLLASAGTVLVLAPYFMQQVVMSIRAEPLAAAGAVWGLAAVIDRLGTGAWRRWLFVACFAFTMAVAAKPTAAYAAAAGVLALAAARRWRDAANLAAGCAAGITLVVLVIWLGSAGRATEASGVLALAGLARGALFGSSLLLEPFALALTSRYLTAMLVLTLAAFATAPRDLLRPLGLLVVTAGAAAAVVLQTPGTIITNQAVEPYVAAALYLVWVAGTRPALRHAGPFVIALLLALSASHEARHLGRIQRDGGLAAARANQVALARAVVRCGDPVLAESPLVPILAGRRPLLLDPFAFRVAAQVRPALDDDIIARLDAREFRCVFLQYDPEASAGIGWYRNVSLGQAVIDAVLRSYEFRETVGGHRMLQPRGR